MTMTKNRNRIRRSIKSTSVDVYAMPDDTVNGLPSLLNVTLPTWYKDDSRLKSAVKAHIESQGYLFIKIVSEPKRAYALYEMTMDEFLEHAHLVKEYNERQEKL